MSNWCENELTVRGKEEDIKHFVNVIGKELDFNKVIPYPRKYKLLDAKHKRVEKEMLAKDGKLDYTKLPKDGYTSGGYDWCCENWGSKWNANHKDFEDGGFYLIYSYDTPWAPPEGVINKLIEMFPKLEFCNQYWEGGMQFTGTITGSKGKVDSHVSGEYKGIRGG